jgi:hypothetical protein
MARTDDYGQRPPTENDAVQALAELVGMETADGLWNLRRPVEEVSDLRRVAEQMMETGEMVRVASRSLKVQAITYDALSRGRS